MPGQIGAEKSPQEYVERLVAVFHEVYRVLRDDGTLWLNLADSYATRSGNQPPTNTRNSCGHTEKQLPDGYKIKDMIGIPWIVALALREDGWYLRQDIIWQKPNCMPESVKDRCTKSHEYIFLLSKQPHYYFDAEAISEPIAESSAKRYLQNLEEQRGSDRAYGKTNGTMKAVLLRFGGNKYQDAMVDRRKSGKKYIPTLRKNKRDVWCVATRPNKQAHFAVFPPELIEPCILAGCPAGGTVLDPFVGSGTTAAVCEKNERDCIGIDLNPMYTVMAKERIYGDTAQGSLFRKE